MPTPAPGFVDATARARRPEFLPFSPPSVGEEEIAEVVDTLRSNWITTGPKTKRFEADFAAYLGAPGALASSSCTAALHTALVALQIGPGDEVVTSGVFKLRNGAAVLVNNKVRPGNNPAPKPENS